MGNLKDILAKLNENQRAAVTSPSNRNLVVAGPGSGKTSVVSARTVFLVEEKKVAPEKIMVLTFSKAAANEMEHRTKVIGGREIQRASFSTIHALAYRILTEFSGFSRAALLSEKEASELFTRAVGSVSPETGRDKEAVSQLLNEVGYLKNTYGRPGSFQSEILSGDRFVKVFERYEERKRENGRLDFDDLLLKAEEHLRTDGQTLGIMAQRFQEVIVDEFQDINPVQFNIIRILAEGKGLMAVGDEDQSIYGFRGSVPEIMVNFRSIYPDSGAYFLERNYRVPEEIMNRAMKLIANNKSRFDKVILPEKKEGKPPKTILSTDFQQEARKIAEGIELLRKKGEKLSDVAVLYRNNSQGAFIAEALANLNLPYQAPDGIYTVYDHWIWKDIYSYMKITTGSGSERDLIQVINKPLRYIGRASIEKAASKPGDFFSNLMEAKELNPSQRKKIEALVLDIGKMSKLISPRDQLGYITGTIGYEVYLKTFSQDTGVQFDHLKEILEGLWEAAGDYLTVEHFLQHAEEMKTKLAQASNGEDRVNLMTMHRSKGLEFGTVFIAGAVEGLSPTLPREKGRAVNIDEERRLFYVAMTRAKNRLYISVPARRFGRSVEPSRFLAEIDGRAVSGCEAAPGMWVFHKIFGEGRILDVVENQGAKLLSIDFQGTLRKLDFDLCVTKGYLTFLKEKP